MTIAIGLISLGVMIYLGLKEVAHAIKTAVVVEREPPKSYPHTLEL